MPCVQAVAYFQFRAKLYILYKLGRDIGKIFFPLTLVHYITLVTKMITKKAKYAIKAMIYLSKKKKGEHALISEISEDEHIPKKFLETILLDLRKAGYLGSKKGKGGGYYLIKSPEEVNMADVV